MKLDSTLYCKKTDQGIHLKVFVQPRSSKNQIAGIHGDALKIKLTAPPVNGAANKMCIQYLAKILGCSKSSIEIISGHSGRNKILLIHGVDWKNQRSKEENIREMIEAMIKN